jgi:hypothetical protein
VRVLVVLCSIVLSCAVLCRADGIAVSVVAAKGGGKKVGGGRWKVEGRCGPVAVGVSASEGLF